jgi:methylglutaconyl-CoA hydratase
MTFETIKIDRDGRGVATITLNRPEKHNALNALMIHELTSAATRLSAEKQVHAVVLAAEGPSFCAGGDLNWMREQATKGRSGKMEDARALAIMLKVLNEFPKFLIGCVQGPVYGGGVGLMAICDIVIAAETARFALTETRLGLIPATISPFVVRRIGEGYTRQVFFTAKPFDAGFALKCGLVSSVVGQRELDGEVESEIVFILKTKPGAVAAAKALCLSLGGDALSDQFEMTAAALADRWETEEAQEGISAFLSKG